MLISILLVTSLFASLANTSPPSSSASKLTRKPKTPVRVASMPVAPPLSHHSIKKLWSTTKDVQTGLQNASLKDRVVLLPQGVLYHSHIEPDKTHSAAQRGPVKKESVSGRLIYKHYNGEEHAAWENVPLGIKAIGANYDASVIAFYHAEKLYVKDHDKVREFVLKKPVKKLKLSADGNTIALETVVGNTLIRPISDVLTKSHVDLPKCTKCRFDLAMGKALCLCTTSSKNTQSSTLVLHNLNAQAEHVLRQFVPRDFGKKSVPVSWLITPDGKHALISTSDAHIHLYDMTSGTLMSHTLTVASGKVKLRALSSSAQFLFTLQVLNKSSGAKESTVWRGDFGRSIIEPLHIPIVGARVESMLAFDEVDPNHVAQRTVKLGSLPVHVKLTVYKIENAEKGHQ